MYITVFKETNSHWNPSGTFKIAIDKILPKLAWEGKKTRIAKIIFGEKKRK